MVSYLLLSFADDPDEVRYSAASIAMECGPTLFAITLVPATQLIWAVRDDSEDCPTRTRTVIRRSLLRGYGRPRSKAEEA